MERMTPLEWALSDDTGLSSKAICAVMTGSRAGIGNGCYPHDNGDFSRCYRLLKIFPEWESRIEEMGKVCQGWIPIAKNWGELKGLYERDEKVGHGTSLTYNRLKELSRECKIAEGWVEKGEGYWVLNK